MDEAGKSAVEPITIVVGLIVHADKQLVLAEAAINDVFGSVPAEYKEGFVFHATQVWNDKKYREHWQQSDRLLFLKQMMSLPRRLNIPIAFGIVRRGFSQHIPQSKLTDDQAEHFACFAMCIARADKYIRDYANPSEIATAVAESDGSMDKYLKHASEVFREEPMHLTKDHVNLTIREKAAGYMMQETEFRVSRIRSSLQFVKKDSDKLILLADACAFGLRRYFSEQQFGPDLVTAMLGYAPPLHDYRGYLSAGTFLHRHPGQPEPF